MFLIDKLAGSPSDRKPGNTTTVNSACRSADRALGLSKSRRELNHSFPSTSRHGSVENSSQSVPGRSAYSQLVPLAGKEFVSGGLRLESLTETVKIDESDAGHMSRLYRLLLKACPSGDDLSLAWCNGSPELCGGWRNTNRSGGLTSDST